MTWVAAFNCNFYTIDHSSQNSLGIGLWSVESPAYGQSYYDDDYSNYCTVYNGGEWGSVITSNDLDGAMTAARVFSMMSCILGVIVFGMILLPACVRLPGNSQYTTYLVWTLVALGVIVLLDLVSKYIDSNPRAAISLWLSYPLSLYIYRRWHWLPISVRERPSARWTMLVSLR